MILSDLHFWKAYIGHSIWNVTRGQKRIQVAHLGGSSWVRGGGLD